MLSREQIEQLEEEKLAPYAMKSKESAKREFPEPEHPTRTCYQRDRDRIVHSEAFRKLEYKTQVFVIFEGDYYRTRLTHTLEVAQIARTIGRNLQLNEDLIEAIALAHDLGHPPFGHAGEEILNKLMGEVGGFNHNKRSFDIVTKFEKRYPDFNGLNLTHEVLIGILKHQTQYDIPGMNARYLQEKPTLEARVVDIADSLAYLNHDIDDGLTSGCITEEDLQESRLWQRALAKLHTKENRHHPEILKYQIVKELIDMQVKDLLWATDERLKHYNFKSSKEARECQEKIIDFSLEMGKERAILQEVLNEKLYHHYRVLRMTSKGQRIIQDLFSEYEQKENLLPKEVREKYKGLPAKELICNYIAGMTDRFAIEEHKRLFNPYERA